MVARKPPISSSATASARCWASSAAQPTVPPYLPASSMPPTAPPITAVVASVPTPTRALRGSTTIPHQGWTTTGRATMTRWSGCLCRKCGMPALSQILHPQNHTSFHKVLTNVMQNTTMFDKDDSHCAYNVNHLCLDDVIVCIYSNFGNVPCLFKLSHGMPYTCGIASILAIHVFFFYAYYYSDNL